MEPCVKQQPQERPGVFISFEGGEGAGKSTHINFLAEALESHGHEVLRLREPGGTAIGERLRDVVLDSGHEEMCPQTELFIYEAARAQLSAQVIAPALREGKVVLCDRFCDSTLAYQVFGRGLSQAFVETANHFATQGIQPHRTILLTCGHPATGLKRATHGADADRLERAGEEFHTRVNEGFLELAQHDPQRIRVVASADSKALTARAVFAQLADIFPWIDGLLAADGDDFFARIIEGSYGNKKRRSS
ncbi:MAG: dTMP kinase [Coriobacteriaceae bacterium]|jgi:dTMP kinase|nr:dTMP kinase [Coriobacteriaceae bacterium]